MALRKYSFLDKLCLSLDQALRTVASTRYRTTGRTYPASAIPDAELSNQEQKHVAGLMRVNHAGEVCAQALYQAQGLISRNAALQTKMQQAAIEENDHLDWCHQRLVELNSHPSYLNPVWYAGSFLIGITAGMLGDTWSLGFVAETEKQVVDHLKKHITLLPGQDQKSAHILQQMQEDEAKHRDEALLAGARALPTPIQTVMRFTSKIMVKTAYWI